MPTVRQIEALLLRFEGKSVTEIAERIGVTKATAAQLARDGAFKLIKHKPKPTMEGLAEKARACYPKIAARYPKKSEETA